MKYSIVIIVKGHILDHFIEISTKVSEKFSVPNLSERVPCHITLKYPFEVDENYVQNIEDRLQKIVKSKKPLKFSINGLGTFEQKTIFFRLQENNSLRSFFIDCIESIGELNEDRKFDINNYHPHISLVRNLTKDNFSVIFEYVSNLNIPPLNGVLDNIAVLVWDNSIWKVKTQFAFLGTIC